jgi:hypothetical protein
MQLNNLCCLNNNLISLQYKMVMDGQNTNKYITTINLYIMILHNTYTVSATYIKITFTLEIYTYKYRIY